MHVLLTRAVRENVSIVNCNSENKTKSHPCYIPDPIYIERYPCYIHATLQLSHLFAQVVSIHAEPCDVMLEQWNWYFLE